MRPIGTEHTVFIVSVQYISNSPGGILFLLTYYDWKVDNEDEALRERLSVRLFSNFIEAILNFFAKNYHGHNNFSRRSLSGEPFPVSWPGHTPRIFRKSTIK